jgi:hypothetical protein
MSSDQYFDAEEIRDDDSDDSAASSGEEEEDNSTVDQADSGDESDQTREPPSPVKYDVSSLPTPVEGAPKMALVKYRSALPHPTVSMENISVMGLLRNNVGKDLSKVAMPIALNEPLNLLQRLCEELEYCELLDQASKTEDPVKRMCLLAGFAVSGYSSTIHRAGRKPFNPLLGETYEMVREDKGFKFVSEKVSHHPPVMACYAESPNYAFYQDSQVKSKFWGKSMELSPSGTVHVKLNGVDDEYSWNKVTTSMRNIFSAGRYLEHHGSVIIKSLKTGHSCELQFKESGYFASAQNEVTGTISDASGKKVLNLSGRWDHSLSFFTDAAPNSLEVIWRAKAHPANFRENYGFTQFAIELNELTNDLKPVLPATDTRFRPDQR